MQCKHVLVCVSGATILLWIWAQHIGTAEVDLINSPFIQTANYTQTHNHNLHSTIKSWQEGRKNDMGGGLRKAEAICSKLEKDDDTRRKETAVKAKWKRKCNESGVSLLLSLQQVFCECKLIFLWTYSYGLALSQIPSERLFVSSIPNKGINVMLMTFQPLPHCWWIHLYLKMSFPPEPCHMVICVTVFVR